MRRSPRDYWISMLNQLESEIVDEAELGPDGKPVKLEQEVEPYIGSVDKTIGELTMGRLAFGRSNSYFRRLVCRRKALAILPQGSG